ncbi:hypothetical protein EDD16DRAFT_1723446 [Pisolithus croceorrhizus]|nr:hypothetical protein EDD16DRAFT_1723446 [Pisolithus croceorrhizus]
MILAGIDVEELNKEITADLRVCVISRKRERRPKAALAPSQMPGLIPIERDGGGNIGASVRGADQFGHLPSKPADQLRRATEVLNSLIRWGMLSRYAKVPEERRRAWMELVELAWGCSYTPSSMLVAGCSERWVAMPLCGAPKYKTFRDGLKYPADVRGRRVVETAVSDELNAYDGPVSHRGLLLQGPRDVYNPVYAQAQSSALDLHGLKVYDRLQRCGGQHALGYGAHRCAIVPCLDLSVKERTRRADVAADAIANTVDVHAAVSLSMREWDQPRRRRVHPTELLEGPYLSATDPFAKAIAKKISLPVSSQLNLLESAAGIVLQSGNSSFGLNENGAVKSRRGGSRIA